MSGYSGTPLAKKLGIKPQFRAAFFNPPPEVKAELKDDLSRCRMANTGEVDFAAIFVKKQNDLQKEFARFARRLAPAGMLWVGWPKKSSGMLCDLNENDVRRIGLAAGLVDVKVCAVNEI
jgi:hypothetical protein